MPLPHFKRALADDQGRLKPFAQLAVVRYSDNAQQTLYEDRDAGSVAAANGVFTAGADGFADFYLPPGLYKMTLTAGGFSTIYPEIKVDELEATIDDAGTSRVASVVDLGNWIVFSNASGITYELDDSVFDIDNKVYFRQSGAGQITIVADTGSSIEPPSDGTLVSHGEGATMALKKVAAHTYTLTGHTEAA